MNPDPQWRDQRVQYLRAGTASYASVLLFVVIALVMIAAVVGLNEASADCRYSMPKGLWAEKFMVDRAHFYRLK